MRLSFLPPDANALVREAIETARTVNFNGVPMRVFRAEYLLGIAVQTGREKDRIRVGLLEQKARPDLLLVRALCERFGLLERFERWAGDADE